MSDRSAQRKRDVETSTQSPSHLQEKIPRMPAKVTVAAVVLLTLIGITTAPRTRVQANVPVSYGCCRPVASRLSQFGYAPYRVMRSDTSKGAWDSIDVTTALAADARRPDGPRILQRNAATLIGAGKMSVALAALRAAAAADPENASILSDLAAAQLASGEPADAAENSAKALQIAPDNAPAAFNWAMAIEALANRRAAIKAWDYYLALDADSGWSQEARQHLSRLRALRPTWEADKAKLTPTADAETLRRVVNAYPQRVRAWVGDDLLPRIVANRRDGDIALLRSIGEIRKTAGDSFLLDLANALRPSDDFTRGISAFVAARQFARDRNFGDAASEFANASVFLRKASSPLALSADIYSASNASYHGDTVAALERSGSAESRAAPYPALHAEAKWVRALILFRIGRKSEAIGEFTAALDLARSCREVEAEAALAEMLGSALDEYNEPADADGYRADGVRRAEEIGATPQRLYVAYGDTFYGWLRSGRPRVALAFIDTQESIARRIADPFLIAESAAFRASALRDIGDLDAAAAAVEAARAELPRIKTEALRDRLGSEIDYAAASIVGRRDPYQALTLLARSMKLSQKYGWHQRVATIYAALGDFRLAVGDRNGAETEFRNGLAEMEQTRGSLDEPRMRVAYFEGAGGLFERLIALLTSEGRTFDALSVAERKRARALLDALERISSSPKGGSPLTAREIQAALPPNTTLIETSILDDLVMLWAVNARGIFSARAPTSRAELIQVVAAYRRAVQDGDEKHAAETARRLYQTLLHPVMPNVALEETIAIVPDGVLFALPFGALIDDAGHYLVESHAVLVAPSASTFIHSSRAARTTSKVLAVGEPRPSDMPQLRNVTIELQKLARIYPRALLYKGDSVAPSDFLRLASGAGLVSFAGHTAGDALIFESRRGGEPSMLTAREIAQSRLDTRPTVVLGACSTGDGRLRLNEGVDSLMTAFLVAGARNVVGTLWDIDDEPSSRLFIAFHENFSRGQSAADALRNAQLSMLRSAINQDRQPISWAGVFLLGSS